MVIGRIIRWGLAREKPALRSALHCIGRAHAVAVAEKDVVPHPDLVAVVEDRRSGQREEQAVQELHLAAVVADQRRQAPADAEVDPHLGGVGVGAIHVVALLVGDHLQRQLVVVAQEQRPLAVGGDLRRLRQDVEDREAILHVNRHEHPRHDRKVEVHVALVAGAEVGGRVLRPLVGLGEQHPVLEFARRCARAACGGTRASRGGSRSSSPRASKR